ncbi:MAG TPA: nitroreductase [Allosphingosinicella sp.]|nr:nitroreductase [Allosphingosinicella sp.]
MKEPIEGHMDIAEAIASRRSVRGFLDREVDQTLLEKLLIQAARAPSGGNLQPWHIHVVLGSRLAELKRIMKGRVAESPLGEGTEYPIYPPGMDSPFRDRNVRVGQQLYGHLGIPREDKDGRRRWFARNYQFFGAPVGLFCAIDRVCGSAQWSDLGMYLQTLMLILREHGLDSCPQECWATYHLTVARFLGLPEHQMLFCGMAIGYADETDPANRLRSERAPPEEFLTFHR